MKRTPAQMKQYKEAADAWFSKQPVSPQKQSEIDAVTAWENGEHSPIPRNSRTREHVTRKLTPGSLGGPTANEGVGRQSHRNKK